MVLKIVLKPGERLYVGTGEISVESDALAKIKIDGGLPVVREKDYLPEKLANTPARQIYLALQRSYLEDNFEKYKDVYFRLVGEAMASKPESTSYLSTINVHLKDRSLYAALKAARLLVQFDEGKIVEGETSAQWGGF